MKTYEFSEKSVKLAEAAHLLGFDVIEKEEIPVCQGRHMKTVVKMENVITSCVLNNEFFPELQPGDKVSVLYIMHYKECNRQYEKADHSDVTKAEYPVGGYVSDFTDHRDFDEDGAALLTNFDIKDYHRYEEALREYRKLNYENGRYMFLKKRGFKFCDDSKHGSLWMTKKLGDLSDFWKLLGL